MNLDDLDTLLKIPTDVKKIPGLITGRADYSEKRGSLQGHLWIDPRDSGYTFTDIKGNTPIMRYDFDFDDEMLSTITTFEQLYQRLWVDINEIFDAIETEGWTEAGLSKGNRNG